MSTYLVHYIQSQGIAINQDYFLKFNKSDVLSRMAKNKRKYAKADPLHPRIYKVTFMLNEEEHRAVARYLSKYKIQNKSRWYRETIITHILKNLDEDYPTLFTENEMRR